MRNACKKEESEKIEFDRDGPWRQSCSVGPEPIPEPNRTDKLRVSVGSFPPFLDAGSVRFSEMDFPINIGRFLD